MPQNTQDYQPNVVRTMFPGLYNLQLAAQRRMARTRTTRERIRRLLTVVTADPESAGLRRHTGGRIALQTYPPALVPVLPPSETEPSKGERDATARAKAQLLVKRLLTWVLLWCLRIAFEILRLFVDSQVFQKRVLGRRVRSKRRLVAKDSVLGLGSRKYDRRALDKFLESVRKRSQYHPEAHMPWSIRHQVAEEHIKDLRAVLAEVTEALSISLDQLETYRHPDFTATLSDDVLLRIFANAGSCGLDSATTLALAHTCPRWRKLVLETPQFWTHMDWTTLPQPLIDHYLTHSSDAHISAIVPVEDRRRVAECGKVLGRLTNLSLCEGAGTSFENIEWLYDDPAPELESLSLKSGRSGDPKNWEFCARWEDGHVLPHPFFAQNHPQLHELTLAGCCLPWKADMYRGLTRLTISLGPVEGLANASNDILHIFRDSPRLEELALHHPKPVPVLTLDTEDALIPMRHLRRLHLTLPVDSIGAILSSIATPPDMRLSLGCVVEKGTHPARACLRLPTDDRCLPCISRIRELDFDVPSHKIVGVSHDTADPIFTATAISNGGVELQEKLIGKTFTSFQQKVILPVLQSLTLRDTSEGVFRDSDLALFLWKGGKTLSNLTLSGCSDGMLSKLAEHHIGQVTPYCPSLFRVRIEDMSIDYRRLLDACKALSRTDRSMELVRVHLDPAQPDNELLKASTEIGLHALQALRFAHVSANAFTWGVSRRRMAVEVPSRDEPLLATRI